MGDLHMVLSLPTTEEAFVIQMSSSVSTEPSFKITKPRQGKLVTALTKALQSLMKSEDLTGAGGSAAIIFVFLPIYFKPEFRSFFLADISGYSKNDFFQYFALSLLYIFLKALMAVQVSTIFMRFSYYHYFQFSRPGF